MFESLSQRIIMVSTGSLLLYLLFVLRTIPRRETDWSSRRGEIVALWHTHPCHVPLCHVPTAFCGGWTVALVLLALSILRFFATFHMAAPFYQSISLFLSLSLYTPPPHTFFPPPSSPLLPSPLHQPPFALSAGSARSHPPLPLPPLPPLQFVFHDPSPHFLSNLSFRSILASFSPISYSTSHRSPVRHHG